VTKAMINAKLLIVLTLLSLIPTIYVLNINNSGTGESGELFVLAPPVLQKPLDFVVRGFTERYGVLVKTSYEPTGSLISKLRLSGRGDVLVTADHEFMQQAVEEGLVIDGSVRVLTYLIPAIIVPKNNPANITSLKDLTKPNLKIAIANPEISPAGRYAVAILVNAGIYEEVKDNIIVYAESISKLASLVALGAVDAAIGFHVMHYWYPNETEIIWLQPQEIPEVACQLIGITKYARSTELSKKFVDFVVESLERDGFWRSSGYITSIEELRTYSLTDKVPEICLGAVK
jgi:molybdate transport system substrate-binding protein